MVQDNQISLESQYEDQFKNEANNDILVSFNSEYNSVLFLNESP